MARTKKQDTTLVQENEQLKALLSLAGRLQPSPAPVTNIAQVGIRNISDNTIGIPAKNGEIELNLHADFGENDPASVAVISYGRYRELVKGNKFFHAGMLIRDDSILGSGYVPAPADDAGMVSEETRMNRVADPTDWIESRTEAQLRADLDKITADTSLRRIRRAVDDRLRELQNSYGAEVEPERRAAKAVNDLPMVYKFVDDYITRRLERPEEFKPKN